MKKLLIASLSFLCLTVVSQNKKVTATSAADSHNWAQMALKAKELIASDAKDGLPYMSEVFRKKTPAQKLSLDITGVKQLVLVTWSTPDGNDYDHGVWADAKLIRKDGSFEWLGESGWKIIEADNNDWIRKDANFANKPFKIVDQTFEHGLLAHANTKLGIDLTKGDFVRFEATIGVDDGATTRGSVVFRVMGTTGDSEAKALAMLAPEAKEKIEKAFGFPLADWLTMPENTLEEMALKQAVSKLPIKEYFNNESKNLLSEANKVKRLENFIELIYKANDISEIQQQIAWLDVKSVGSALKDMKLGKEYQDKFTELQELAKTGFKGFETLDPTAVSNAKKALTLKREILLANPLLDMDKIIVTRYNLGGRARVVQPNAMGTQPNNWSCQMSSARSGFDAEIIELSNLRGDKLNVRQIYKPEGDRVVTDVQLHWNADRMIFTSQDKERRFQVFEVPIEGGNANQLTQIPEPDVEFFDAAYLPSGKMIVNTNLGYHGVPCVNGDDAVGNFALFDPATQQLRRLCYDQDNNWNPTVMANGRVLYTRWEYTDLMHYYSRIVMNMNPDGTENKAFYGSGSMFPNSTYDLAPIPGSSSSFLGIVTGHHGTIRSGRLMLFDINKGRKGVDGMVQEIPFSNREIVPLVKDELVDGVWPQFIKPQPINEKYFLVTAKLTPESLWGVYLVDVFDNMTLLAEFEGEGLINPIPVIKREVPQVIPERVPMDLENANMESTVFIQDIYEGEGLKGVPRGTVKELRVLAYEYAYLRSPSDHIAHGVQSGWDIKRELGRVKVEEDGSAIFKIPANLPISLQPLDENGAAIQLMRSWLTGQPGETVSCIGCHEDQSQIPIPKRVIASTKKPDTITPPEGGVRPFTFELEIQPILDRACVACHNGEKLAGGIDYTGGRMIEARNGSTQRRWSKSYLQFHPYFYRQGPEAEMAVLNPMEYHIDNSEMIQMLRAGHHGVELTAKEWERLTTWVDFNLPYVGVFNEVRPYKSTSGEVIDQKKRRVELAKKYANEPVDWMKEIEDYTAYLAAQPKPEPTMPSRKPQAKAKEVKAKGYPFSAEVAKAMVAGKEKKVVDLGNGETMTFVYIPKGTFVAGGNGKNSTKQPYKVKIEKGFWMSETEVSNAQMRALIPTHDSRYVGQFWKDHTTPGYYVNFDEYSATKVSYQDAVEYARLLSEKTGLKANIPTEEQWEWAARAGSDSDFWYGDRNTDFSKYENLADVQLTKMAVTGVDPQPMRHDHPMYPYSNYIPKIDAVDDGKMLVCEGGVYMPNPWGLYDVHGNVAEWTRSDFESLSGHKVVRGGSWYDRPKKSTSSIRRGFEPWQKVWNVGLRVIIEE